MKSLRPGRALQEGLEDVRTDVQHAAQSVQTLAWVGIAVLALVGFGVIVALARTGGNGGTQ